MSAHMLLIRGMPTGAYIDIDELHAALAPQRAVHVYVLLGVEFPPAGVGGPAVKWPLSVQRAVRLQGCMTCRSCRSPLWSMMAGNSCNSCPALDLTGPVFVRCSVALSPHPAQEGERP